MSEFEVNQAKNETEQSNAQLEKALDHFKDAVDTGAETVGQKREKLNHLMGDKRQAAQDFIQNTFEGAETLLNRQTELLHRTLTNTRTETENFLKDVQIAVDSFARDLQGSVSRLLGGLEDRRVTTFATLFLAGCLVGSFLGRRYMSRAAPPTTEDWIQETDELRADINPATSEEMKKIA
jgi:ABC-type transporter Mla subunit MlaD